MKQLISYYRMPGDREEEISRLIHAEGLDGVENLIYGSQAGSPPFLQITVGTHLRYWPYWMDFYEGNKDRLFEIFTNPGASAIPMKKFWQRRQSSISLSAI